MDYWLSPCCDLFTIFIFLAGCYCSYVYFKCNSCWSIQKVHFGFINSPWAGLCLSLYTFECWVVCCHSLISYINIYFIRCKLWLRYVWWQFSTHFPKYTSSVCQRSLKNFTQVKCCLWKQSKACFFDRVSCPWVMGKGNVSLFCFFSSCYLQSQRHDRWLHVLFYIFLCLSMDFCPNKDILVT